MKLLSAYLYKGLIHIPVNARTDAGYFLEVPPVETLPITSLKQLPGVISGQLSRGAVRIPALSRDEFPKISLMEEVLGIRGQRNIEQKVPYISMAFSDNGNCELELFQPSRKGWDSVTKRIIQVSDDDLSDVVSFIGDAARLSSAH